jgi:hypothetical protein
VHAPEYLFEQGLMGLAEETLGGGGAVRTAQVEVWMAVRAESFRSLSR